jgi:murein DD-endopeptidase MepM/ murein hydrolase activator NlpD
MPNDASLFDIIQMFLPDTLHHFAPIGSPYFNPDALHKGMSNPLAETDEERAARLEAEAEENRPANLEERLAIVESFRDGSFAQQAVEDAFAPLLPPSPATDEGEGTEEMPLMAVPAPINQSEQWTPPVDSPPGTGDGQLYGAQRSYGGHTGIDYPVVRGTAVRAVRTGRVVYARNSGSGYGLKVEIDHGDGYKSLYAHLSQISVSEGSTIQGGVVIGLSGNSGGNYGYHLHFGIYRNGTAQDPNRLLGNTTRVSPFRMEAARSTPTYTLQEGAGAMPTLIIKPELDFSPPPPCNVFFPHHYTSITAREDFARSPTRLMLYGNPYFAHMGQMGSIERNQAVPLHFAPRYLRFIFNALRGGQHTGVLDVGQNPNEVSGDVQNYLQALKTAPGADTLRLQNDAVTRHILEQSRRQQDAQNRSSEDIISRIMDGDTDAPEGLAGLFTYDELFRGILPSVAQFPFIEDASAGQEIEQRVLEALRSNADLLAASFPDSQTSPFNKAYQKSAAEGAPSTALDLYAGHRFAVMRREASTAGIMGPLNLNVVCGFTGAFYEPTLGWTYGMVESVQDEIDANGVATTTVNFSKCTFMGDLDDPIYSKFRTEAEAEASSLAASGVPENPAFFEERFAANEVGANIYQPLIGQKSILDLVRQGEESLSTDQALTTLIERYRSQKSPALWGDRITGRRIATEGEVMQHILEASPRNYDAPDDAPPVREQRHEEYEAQYAVHELPTPQQSFMEERSDWARKYRDDLRTRNTSLHAIDPAPLSPDDSEGDESA